MIDGRCQADYNDRRFFWGFHWLRVPPLRTYGPNGKITESKNKGQSRLINKVSIQISKSIY